MTTAPAAAHPFRTSLARATLVATLLALPGHALASQFVSGLAVRVTPNSSIAFEWLVDVAWFGRVDIFDSQDATTPIFQQWAEDTGGNHVGALHQLVVIPVAGPITADTTFWFQVTSQDPGDPLASFSSSRAPFFTGVQALSGVMATSITATSATIEWQANVIGFGRVDFGTSSTPVTGTLQDGYNITDHAIALGGLSPGTTYYFTASNLHAVDGAVLAYATGQFTTPSIATAAALTEPKASPRVIEVGQVSTVSVRVKDEGTPISGVTVGFAVDPSGAGSGTLSAAQVSTDSTGVAAVQFTATRRGLVNVTVFSSTPGAKSQMIPVVVR